MVKSRSSGTKVVVPEVVPLLPVPLPLLPLLVVAEVVVPVVVLEVVVPEVVVLEVVVEEPDWALLGLEWNRWKLGAWVYQLHIGSTAR